MLGKAMKYELQATARVFLPCYAILVAVSVIYGLFFTYSGDNTNIIFVLLTMLMVMLFTAVWIVTFVLLIRRFWNNLLGREGYLMHTLPVKPWEHVMSKMLTAFIWSVCSLIASIAAFAFMFSSQVDFLSFKDIGEFFSQLTKMINEHNIAGSVTRFCIEIAVLSILGSFFSILTVYLSMTIGQLVNKHRAWLSVGAYIGISAIVSSISSYFNFGDTLVAPFSDNFSTFSEVLSVMNSSMLIGIGEMLVLCVAFFVLTAYLLRNCLNLK